MLLPRLDAAPDHYVNEEWFGITSPDRCGDSVNALAPRRVYWTMRKLWVNKDEDSSLFARCHEVLDAQCANKDSEGGSGLFGLLAPSIPGATCSGRGDCVTDWKKCGPGDENTTSTPCCFCDFGFAGPTCEQLDARLYLALAAGGVLALVLLLLLAISLTSAIRNACCPTGPKGSATQPLLARA